jgi:prepilin-type N-terminal cleavage/methylation domain-containing protein
MHKQQSTQRKRSQAGLTLIELMVALTILAVGLLGSMVLITTAISSNNRNKVDVGGTQIAQLVMERIAAQPANRNDNVIIQDCNPAGATSFTVATTAGGATLDAQTGNINWLQAAGTVPANYSMRYVACGALGSQATFEVRWSIAQNTNFTKVITVSARQVGVTAQSRLQMFIQPVTLRTISGV